MPSQIKSGGAARREAVEEVPLFVKTKSTRLWSRANLLRKLVAPTGLEPVTQGSSGLCSTN